MLRSPPSRRRGLKYIYFIINIQNLFVASFAEAWIEIYRSGTLLCINVVASFAEAWIEIPTSLFGISNLSRLLRGGVD